MPQILHLVASFHHARSLAIMSKAGSGSPFNSLASDLATYPLAAPSVALAWFQRCRCMQLHAMHTLQGKSHEVKNKLRNDLKPTVIANWKLWVPAQFINFRMVPPHLQVRNILLY